MINRRIKSPAELCVVLIVAAFYISVFTNWGNPFHGPGPWSAMAMDASIVLASYSTLELFREKRAYWFIGLPLVALLALRLYWAISQYYLPWLGM